MNMREREGRIKRRKKREKEGEKGLGRGVWGGREGDGRWRRRKGGTEGAREGVGLGMEEEKGQRERPKQNVIHRKD